MDTWKADWDWAEALWGDNRPAFFQFFRIVAGVIAEQEKLEEVGSSDVWHLTHWMVQSARESSVETNEALMEYVCDQSGIYGFRKKAIIGWCESTKKTDADS